MTDSSISAVIPAYNRAHLIGRSISSALAQLESSDEIIVVDDGSTDHTAMVVKQFGDKVKYIKTTNNGAGAARNRGVEEASKPLVAFLDSDDEWMPGKIELQRLFLEARPDILFCFTNCAYRSKDGEQHRFTLDTWHEDDRPWDRILGDAQSISDIISLPDEFPEFSYYVGDIYRSALEFGNYLNVNTLLVRRLEAGNALRFTENTKIFEEWECLSRLSRIGKCAYLDCETVWQNGHFGSRITDADELDRVVAQVPIMERIWGSDETFLRKHGDFYEGILRKRRLAIAGGLILRGHTPEARRVLSRIDRPPTSHVMLAAMPGLIAKPISAIVRKLKHIVAF